MALATMSNNKRDKQQATGKQCNIEGSKAGAMPSALHIGASILQQQLLHWKWATTVKKLIEEGNKQLGVCSGAMTLGMAAAMWPNSYSNKMMSQGEFGIKR